jgi:hypothetical protein
MLLLSDEVDIARRRDIEVRAVQQDLAARRRKVESEIQVLLGARKDGIDIEEGESHPQMRPQHMKVAERRDAVTGGDQAEATASPARIEQGLKDDDDDDFEEV